MARAYQRTVTTAQTIVADCKTLGGGGSILVRNIDAASSVYLCGDENVDANAGGAANSTSVGFLLGPSASFTVNLAGNEAIYASGTTTVTLHVFRSNLPG